MLKTKNCHPVKDFLDQLFIERQSLARHNDIE